jgi:ketosteroid isomerase-like protein
VSQERLVLVTALAEAINQRNLDELSNLLHTDYEFHAAIGAVEQRRYVGESGLRAFVADMDTIWEGYRIELNGFREAGEQSVVLMHVTGTARASGVPLDQDLAQVITWRDGTIAQVVAYTVLADALKAAGLEG